MFSRTLLLQQSRLQYSVSDFQNLQRRSAEEFAQASEKGIKKFAGDLLSTIDILTLALKHVPQPIPADNVALKALFDGVEMTQVELLKTLKKHGVEPINPVGEKFDPHFHEALYMAPVPGKEPGTVLEVQQVGYTLKGKSLRAAQVGVVRPSPFCPLPPSRRSASDQRTLSFSRTCRSGIRCVHFRNNLVTSRTTSTNPPPITPKMTFEGQSPDVRR